MKNNRTIMIIVIAIIVVAGLVYLLPSRGGGESEQPSPHAIDQSN
ncbi:hypothetical protein [Neorhizobium sp. SOG26]|nr:hypothetical protein [Neorhizobium sp. SOG26]